MAEERDLREKTEREKNQVRDAGRQVLRSDALVRALEWIMEALLGAVLAGGRVLGGGSPFGVAWVAACGAGFGGMSALLGAAFGYLVSRGLEEGLRYTAAAILTFSASFAFYDTSLYKKPWFLPAVVAALDGATGLVTLAAQPWTAALAADFLGEIALTAVGVYAFRCALTLWEGREDRREATFRQRFSLCLLGLAALISLAELVLLGMVSLGRCCAALAALAAGFAAGPGGGAAVGVVAGLAMDLSAGRAPFYAMAYGFSGLVAGLLRRRNRVTSAAGFTLASGGMVLWSWESGVPLGALYEVCAACVVFFVIPEGALRRFGLLFAPEPRQDKTVWAAQEASRRLKGLAGAFGQVFNALRATLSAPEDFGENPSVIFDRAANRTCAHCALRERCWQTDYEDTHDLLNGILPTLLAKTEAEGADFPQRFRDKCIRLPTFVAAVGEELSAYLLRRQYRGRLGESRRAVCGQYGDMAKLLEETVQAMAAPLTPDPKRTRKVRQFLAGRELACDGLVFYDDQGHLQLRLEGGDAWELAGETGRESLSSVLDVPLAPGEKTAPEQLVFRQREPLAALAGVAGQRKSGQKVNGDGGAWFKDDKGGLFLILCDGMGSGPEAQRDSQLTIHLLEQFLRAGVTPGNALKTLNRALALREEDTGSFSTIDLLTLDLYTGQGVLYKLGAAPSYLKRGGGVTRIAGKSFPAGLVTEGFPGPDRAAFQVSPGDCLVLLTDGVPTEDDSWLRAELTRFDGGSPAALAQSIVSHGDGMDDRTALVLQIALRPSQPDAA